jgi:hypothetical protein
MCSPKPREPGRDAGGTDAHREKAPGFRRQQHDPDGGVDPALESGSGEILTQVTVGRRNRAFEASEIVDAFADLERQLASPEGNTRASEPSRRVPYRGTRR